MKNRLGLIAAAVTAGLLITGISWAALDRAGSTLSVDLAAGQDTAIQVEDAGSASLATSVLSTTTVGSNLSTGTESTVNIALAAGQESAIQVEDAGSIRLANSGNSLSILSAQAAAGFVVEVEVPEGREVEADFRGEGRRIQFNAELEDGTVRVRIRTEGNAAVTGSTSTTSTTNTTNGTSTTATTVDDNGGDGSSGNVPTGPVTYDVSGAGTVTILFINGQAQLGLVSPAPGWSIDETRQRSDEVEVRFSNGDDEARLKVRIDDGQVRVEIENKD
ncbi:MAG: hypothetical protein WD651_12320 [Acidimicrobiia bacterium]